MKKLGIIHYFFHYLALIKILKKHPMKVAIIPARGGSKRIPKKNIKSFLGKPIIAYSIEVAIKSKLFDRIIVTTDDDEIAEVSKQFGAEIPFMRPKELADDMTPTVPVIKHAIETLKQQGCDVTMACCIYATAPFVNEFFLKEAYFKLLRDDRSYVFSATPFSFPIFRAFKMTQNDNVEMFWPEHYNTRSQDLPKAYQDAGQFYWGKANAFLADKPFFCNESSAIILPSYLVQDIDTPDDWMRAELMMRALNLA